MLVGTLAQAVIQVDVVPVDQAQPPRELPPAARPFIVDAIGPITAATRKKYGITSPVQTKACPI